MKNDLFPQALSWRVYRLVLIVGPITTLLISPWTNYDPINLIKVLFFTTIAFFLFGIFVSNVNFFREIISKPLLLCVIGFILFLFLPLITTQAPRNQQFWGMQGRSTGILTYFSLTIILLSASIIKNEIKYRKIIQGLLIAVVINTVYCLIQIAKLDPVHWSEYQPFGTLGNVNFLSAFFGMSSLMFSILALDSRISLTRKLSLLSLVILDLAIVLITQSIQGVMIYFAGSGIALFIFLAKKMKSKILNYSYLIVSTIAFITTVLALFNKGPLKSFIFQRSIEFRSDYIHAGWAMTLANPFTGVGIDSYGDWYRTVRGFISTNRTGPDRVANTSHNIFLDISSSGGIILLIFYLGILFLAFKRAFIVIKSSSKFEALPVAIFSSWLAYQIQACISINQVGVGVWNWILTGLLIGYPIQNENISNQNLNLGKKIKGKKNHKVKNTLDAKTSLTFSIFGLVGFVLAFIPWKADVDFRSALDSKDLSRIESAATKPGATAFHLGLAIDTAASNNYGPQAYELAQKLIARYPRDFYGWKVLSVLTNATVQERSNARKVLKQLDPYNPELQNP